MQEIYGDSGGHLVDVEGERRVSAAGHGAVRSLRDGVQGGRAHPPRVCTVVYSTSIPAKKERIIPSQKKKCSVVKV